ncbi:uncharacterized protein LOC121508752 isoform X2 [Cheilinus undulatus]|uniref:uncharacterized protein LOC121508752 isoform X2 n=1 Tax=Cheilinus undulatus TaxID=241271 RepID=UPI001BD61441|nr:uncharacterized protein LOC121508752 isoform X2 [Cheilinus undulatus]
MIRAEVGCVFMGLIMCISGFLEPPNHRICALKSSTVNLPCITKNNKTNMRWYTLFAYNSLSQREVNYDTDDIFEDNHQTLTIKDVRESDEDYYCCAENAEQPGICWNKRIQLRVADLQVKVIPATEGQKVTLMCSTSCPLTESPSAYIWYKNGEFLYEDWSPWYQELVSSDRESRYSCAVKGYEDFRAPEVSVNFVDRRCFGVTYTDIKYCPSWWSNGTCFILYPMKVWVVSTHNGDQLTCHDSCVNKGNCWRVNYVSRRICALEGSSVNITSEYSHPSNQWPKHKHWYKLKNGRVEDAEMMTEAVDRVRFYDNMKNQHILKMTNLKKNDSAEYRFRLQQDDKEWRKADIPGVKIIVTDLRVTFSPSAEVTEGQRVTLTCSTSCPLTDDANYIWYWNTQLLTPPENQSKHLIVEAVSMQHAGNYSCAVNTLNDIRSNEKTLTVHRKMGTWILAAATAAFLVLMVLIVIFWIRKNSPTQTPQTETSSNMEQQNSVPLYENTPAPPAEPDDPLYSRSLFTKNHQGPLYSTIQPHLQQEQDDERYIVVFR